MTDTTPTKKLSGVRRGDRKRRGFAGGKKKQGFVARALEAERLCRLRLMASSNLVGCTTGNSAGLAPSRILPA